MTHWTNIYDSLVYVFGCGDANIFILSAVYPSLYHGSSRLFLFPSTVEFRVTPSLRLPMCNRCRKCRCSTFATSIDSWWFQLAFSWQSKFGTTSPFTTGTSLYYFLEIRLKTCKSFTSSQLIFSIWFTILKQKYKCPGKEFPRTHRSIGIWHASVSNLTALIRSYDRLGSRKRFLLLVVIFFLTVISLRPPGIATHIVHISNTYSFFFSGITDRIFVLLNTDIPLGNAGRLCYLFISLLLYHFSFIGPSINIGIPEKFINVVLFSLILLGDTKWALIEMFYLSATCPRCIPDSQDQRRRLRHTLMFVCH